MPSNTEISDATTESARLPFQAQAGASLNEDVPLLEMRAGESRDELYARLAEHFERLGITEEDIQADVKAIRAELHEKRLRSMRH